MSDTPITDENAFGAVDEYGAVRNCVSVVFARHFERELASATRERDEALRLLAEARAAAPDADPREQPIVGMVHDSRHGVYVDLPRWWLGRRLRVQALRDGGANNSMRVSE